MASHPDTEPASSLIGALVGGRYRIEALVGQGGMGAVYRAEHVHMRKAVAVKVLHREMTLLPEVVARFEREAVAAGRIENPHVAAATDLGRLDDGSFYMVLEFVEGQGLGSIIQEHGTLPERRALLISRQIADALSAAHAAEIVHRDLKPENVMLVERNDGTDLVKVLDFGIAKIQLGTHGDRALTQLGSVFGTPEYMAPEQAQGRSVDARADLYSAGLILYEMLSGVSPFRHEDLVVTLSRQITMDPPPLPESISEPTRALIAELLRKNPEDRLKSALELREALDQILDSLPIPEGDSRTDQGPDPAPKLPAAPRRSGWMVLRGPWSPLAIRNAVLALVATLSVSLVLWTLDFSGSAELDRSPKLPEPDLVGLVSSAERGDRHALAALSRRRPESRKAIEWRALGRGSVAIGELKSGLSLYSEGIQAYPELGADPMVIRDVRGAARHPELAKEALELAAGALGAPGADLLYDVWEEQKGTSSESAKLARALLDQEPAKSKQSPALRAVLDLQVNSKRWACGEFKKQLPSFAEAADQRSVPWLARLKERRGCGFLGLRDCYACLRSNNDLSIALSRAQSRPRPEFGNMSPPVASETRAAPSRTP